MPSTESETSPILRPSPLGTPLQTSPEREKPVSSTAEVESQQKKPSRRRHRIKTVLVLSLLATVLTGLVGLMTWLFLRVQFVDVYVDSAALTTFNLTSTGILRHNVSTQIKIRNSGSSSVEIHCDRLRVEGYYNGQYQLSSATLPEFSLWAKKARNSTAVLAGDARVQLGQPGVILFDQQKREGAFDLQVRLFGRLRNKVGQMTMRTTEMQVKCWLPGLRVGGSARGFNQTKCERF